MLSYYHLPYNSSYYDGYDLRLYPRSRFDPWLGRRQICNADEW